MATGLESLAAINKLVGELCSTTYLLEPVGF